LMHLHQLQAPGSIEKHCEVQLAVAQIRSFRWTVCLAWHPPVNSQALAYAAVAREITCYSLMSSLLTKWCTSMRHWVKMKMSVVAAASRFSHRTLSAEQNSRRVGGVRLMAGGLHRYSNLKLPRAIQALQQVCASTLRVLKWVTTALPVSRKIPLCSLMPGDWISGLYLKPSKNSTLESLS